MSDARPARPHNTSDARARARVRSDTIVAVATATGRSALAVVRLSGPDAERIGRVVLSPWPERARTMVRCTARDPSPGARVVDDCLAVVFPAPHSYTGETILEVHTHGGRYIPGALVAAFIYAGARQALPGEFTERAVLNGKLDLVRAEAIGELIDARTTAAHRSAMHAMSGDRSRAYGALRDAALEVDALIAYDIDFPDEDHGPLARARVEAAAVRLHAQLRTLIDSAPAAAVARDGALVVLAGPPNAGKSTLFNALLGEARAIVSDEPGTTRDAIEALLDSDPWPIRLVDTAGLRDDPGAVERLGIEVSERYLRTADVVVLCVDSDSSLTKMRTAIGQLTQGIVLPVRTKADLSAAPDHLAVAERSTSHMSQDDKVARRPRPATLSVSALTGDGIGALLTSIMGAVSMCVGDPAEHPFATANARQRAALNAAESEMEEFLTAWRADVLPSPVVATHLRAATRALDELIGVIDTDDILARVFSTFCVGK